MSRGAHVGAPVSEYAYDCNREALIVLWPSVAGGRVAADIVTGGGADERSAAPLCALLTSLSEEMWRALDTPAPEDASEFQWTDMARSAVRAAQDLVMEPRRPTEDGFITVSYIEVEELAHRVGRALDHLPETWRQAVADDARREAYAAERAGLGDFAGRAEQGLVRESPAVSPLLFDAAVGQLLADVRCAQELAGVVGLAAACAGSSLLLQAAAAVASEASGVDASQVFAEADNIQEGPIEVPSRIVTSLEGGEHVLGVVERLLSDAHAVRRGFVPDLADLTGRLAESGLLAAQWEVDAPDVAERLAAGALQLTHLDPVRPAASLLEEVLGGLRAAELLWAEFFRSDHDGDEEEDDTAASVWSDEVQIRFKELVKNMSPSGS